MSITEITEILERFRWPDPDDPQSKELLSRNVALRRQGRSPPILVYQRPDGTRDPIVIRHVGKGYLIKIYSSAAGPERWLFTIGDRPEDTVWTILQDGDETERLAEGNGAFAKLQEILGSCEIIDKPTFGSS